jgi:AcrR family transcriptional regulator
VVNIDASARNRQRDSGQARGEPDASPPSAAGAVSGAHGGPDDATRRTEILKTANTVIATSGLRSSLQQIADAAGILAGSLYHHFESKEAILIELIRRYHADLDRIGEVALARLDLDTRPPSEQIIDLGRAIARCAVEHRAALQMSFYEGPSTDPQLIELTRHRPTNVTAAMLQTLRAARWSGCLRSDVELPILADRICQSMLHVGLDVIRHGESADAVATLICTILLHGLAIKPLNYPGLDASRAFAAARQVISTWADKDGPAGGDTAAHVRAVARAQFGRRGYEMTTVRDIASAAGVGTGTVYRAIGTKEDLLKSIMLSFGRKVGAGWTNVMASDSTPVEKLDALSWVNINALARFPDEFRIQLAWLRQSPPDIANPGWSFTTRVRQMEVLLSDGITSGEIRLDSPSAKMSARCVIGIQWIPENIQEELGFRHSLILARDTVLRGVIDRAF